MFLNDDDKQIVHYILSAHCRKCGLDVDDYFSYNQFLGLCPRHDCGKMVLIRELVKSCGHLNIRDYLGIEYPYNEDWKHFFRGRKGWV